MWHASVAVMDEGQPVPPLATTDAEARAAATQCAAMLAGVGMEPSRFEPKDIAFHLRRSLSDAEIARLDPAWLAIPAVDMG